MKRKQIQGSVVVITGASSGIGYATALEFARRGARLVLVSRSETALAQVAADARELRAAAVVAPADVSRYADVERVVAAALDAFGRIDVWINAAAVAQWSPVESMPPADIQRVIDVTLLGTLYGVRAALPHLIASGGTIINVASALADRSVPLLSTYCAAKAGVRGFTESLRMELKASGTNVDVVTVLPASINTPFYTWGPSRLGVRPHPLSVIYPPQAVARAIVAAAERPQRNVYVGLMAKLLSLGQRFSPTFMDWYMLQNDRMIRQQYSERPDRGESNLYETPGDARIDGDFTEESRRTSVYSDLIETRPAVRRLLGATIGIVMGLLFLRRRKSR